MTPESLSRLLEEFLGGSRHAVVLEDGARAFDLTDSKYSVSGEYNKCLLHLWSAEPNAVRRILDAEVRTGNLRLMVQKLGQSRPSKLEICRGVDRRTPTARRTARSTYQQHLRRALERHSPGFAVAKLSSAMDLEPSFGPIYARGVLRQGHTAFAVLGVNEHETQGSIDVALTFAVLWLDTCRNSADHRVLVEGVKLFLPAGTAALTRERLANLHPGPAKWQLYEFDERHDAVTAIDDADRGNIATRRVRCPDEAAVLDRFSESIHRVLSFLPECEVVVLSTSEVAFRWRGLEFARARVAHEAGSFRSGQEILFGVGAEERVLEERSVLDVTDLIRRLRSARGPHGARQQSWWRLHPERWLESLVLRAVSSVDQRLDTSCLYSPGAGFFGIGSCHARRAYDHPRPSPRGCRTQSERRHPLATARTRLLVARAVAPRPRGVSAVRLFSRPGAFAGGPVAVSGGPPPYSSGNRHRATFRPISIGRWLESTNAGALVRGRSFGSERSEISRRGRKLYTRSFPRSCAQVKVHSTRPTDGAALPTVPGGTRCDRPPATLRATRSAHHPTGSGRTSRSLDSKSMSPSSSGPSESV